MRSTTGRRRPTSLTRRIIQETISPDAPPEVTGIGNAFHVTGDLPGSGETQIFLTTADNRPVSIGIQRTPGEQPRWSVALSELVGEGAVPPARDTLLWYRLACALPPALPDSSVASLTEKRRGHRARGLSPGDLARSAPAPGAADSRAPLATVRIWPVVELAAARKLAAAATSPGSAPAADVDRADSGARRQFDRERTDRPDQHGAVERGDGRIDQEQDETGAGSADPLHRLPCPAGPGADADRATGPSRSDPRTASSAVISGGGPA